MTLRHSFELQGSSDADKCACGEWYPEHSCWTCHDGGRVRVTEDRDDPRFGQTIVCPDCTASETVRETAERVRIPLIFADETIETWMPADGTPRARAEQFASALNGSFFLYGPKGTGKSHLGCGVLKRAVAKGLSCRFEPVVDLLARYRSAANPEFARERAEEIDAEMRRPAVLMLDDIGIGKSTEFAEECLFRIIDERYRNRRPLIVTTNADLGALEERVRSRLMGGTVAQTSGADRRIAG